MRIQKTDNLIIKLEKLVHGIGEYSKEEWKAIMELNGDIVLTTDWRNRICSF